LIRDFPDNSRVSISSLDGPELSRNSKEALDLAKYANKEIRCSGILLTMSVGGTARSSNLPVSDGPGLALEGIKFAVWNSILLMS
jgi:hypothetical protein